MEQYEESIRFLVSYLEGLKRSEGAEEYLRQAENYLDRLRRADQGLICHVSVINVPRGVGIYDPDGGEYLIAADCERAARDLFRRLPIQREITCYFDAVYSRVAAEYLSGPEQAEGVWRIRGRRPGGYGGIRSNGGKATGRVIGSKKEEVVSQFRQYTTLKTRIDTGHVVMEGMLLAKRALKDSLPVEKLIYCDSLDSDSVNGLLELCEKNGVTPYRAGQGIMAAMTNTNPVPEVLCSVRLKVHDQRELIFSDRRNFFLILDGISNPDNLGMVLRTADASGVDAVILLSGSVHPFNKNAIRGARGAVGRIPLYYCTDDFELMELLQGRHFKIMGTSAHFQSSNLYDMVYDVPNLAIVVGNESTGVRKEILDRCTDFVKIPMAEGQSSLNIAVAAALMLYEYDRAVYHTLK